jgi:hypothetical protein
MTSTFAASRRFDRSANVSTDPSPYSKTYPDQNYESANWQPNLFGFNGSIRSA